MGDNTTLLDTLKRYWGYDSFREGQREIVENILAGKDTLVLMPTGGGKSLTFQLPALIKEGITVVITPLISLMKDQVDRLQSMGIAAMSIDGSMSHREIDYALDNCIYGDYKFLYVSPERIVTSLFKYRFERMNVSLIVVDEAHCISQWGYDFRPPYLQIGSLRELHPNVPIIALTATATSVVVSDIIKYLKLDKSLIYRQSFMRNNISFLVRNIDNKFEHLLKVVTNILGCGIVYVGRRKDAEDIAAQLIYNGVSADFYHAGLSSQLRRVKQDSWMRGSIRVIVATNAFGMGIDKSDVRFVVHVSPPSSLESYYQEAGRAGRDGKESYAVLLYDNNDRRSNASKLSSSFPSRKEICDIYEKLFNHYQIAIEGGKDESYAFDIMEFCQKFKVYSTTVYHSIKLLQYIGYMSLSEEYESRTRIRFIVRRDELYRLQLRSKEIDGFVNVMLRLYTGLFSGFVTIDELFISRQSGYSVEKIKEFLLTLSRQYVITYIPSRSSAILSFIEERLPLSNLYIPKELYETRKSSAETRLAAMDNYIQCVDKCRSVIVCEYFGEEEVEPCGKCDYCRGRTVR